MRVNLVKYLATPKFQATLAISAGLHLAIYFFAPAMTYESQESSYSIEIFTYQVNSELKRTDSQNTNPKKVAKINRLLKGLKITTAAQIKTGQPENLEENQKIETLAQESSATSSAPELLFKVIPKLPLHFQTENLKTSVLIEFAVSINGDSKPEILESSKNQELDQLAFEAATQWQFKPAIKNGVTVPSKVRLRINFSVK